MEILTILPVLYSKACASLANKDTSPRQLTELLTLTSLLAMGLALALWLVIAGAV